MDYELVLQWAVLFLTTMVLVWVSKGKSNRQKKSVVVFQIMTLLLNAGYLFELMSTSEDAALIGVELEYCGLIFMSYFMCRFFCYYVRGDIPSWIAVYLFIFDALVLFVTWTSAYHNLIFANTTYEYVNGEYYFRYAQGPLYWFIGMGCVVIPPCVVIAQIAAYFGKECSRILRRRILLIGLVLLASFGFAVLSVFRVFPGYYDPSALISAVLADLFLIRFWGKGGFDLETVSNRRTYENLKEGVVLLDDTLELKFYNDAAKSIFPELEPEVIGHNIQRLHSVPMDLFEEYERKEIDLGSRHYEVIRSEVVDDWNMVRGIVLIFTDLTMEYNYIAEITSGRKKAENAEHEALRALEEAKQANRLKSDFLANVSHEIRTPMNAIVGLSELIIEESRGRKVFDFACDIKNASSNLLAIIDDILSLSKMEAGQMTLLQQEYSTEQMLEETLHLLKVTASSRGLQLKRSISPKLPCRLVGDEMRIRQMITNFLDFGMKYTERGFVKLTATHKWLDEDTILMVYQFEDTGTGFTPEELNGLFEQYQVMDDRTDRNLESIGLGIAITRRFVDLMEGRVEVTSEVGKGTTFTVCFPQKVADIHTIEQQPWHKLDVQEQVQRAFIVPDYKVLLVDDNKINLKVAAGSLSIYKFQVEQAKSGRQAIDMVKENVYDMILMDHMMPEMDGIETTDHIRHDCGENGEKPIIIALSANAYNNAREMFMSNGFQDFIAKPIDKNELDQMLRKWIPEERRLPVDGTEEAEIKVARAEVAELYMTGVDVTGSLKKHSGGMDSYLELLELYYMDGAEKHDLIARLAEAEDYKNYEIEVHGLKSASANIGADEFSELAKSHEFAAKEGNYTYIKEGVSKLLSEYNFLLHEIEKALKSKGYLKTEEQEQPQGEMLSEEETRSRMQAVLADIEDFQSKAAAEKVDALLAENLEQSARECLKDVKNKLKMYDDDTAEDLLRAFLG